MTWNWNWNWNWNQKKKVEGGWKKKKSFRHFFLSFFSVLHFFFFFSFSHFWLLSFLLFFPLDFSTWPCLFDSIPFIRFIFQVKFQRPIYILFNYSITLNQLSHLSYNPLILIHLFNFFQNIKLILFFFSNQFSS